MARLFGGYLVPLPGVKLTSHLIPVALRMSGAMRLHGGDRENFTAHAFYHPSSFKIPFNIIISSAHAFWKCFFSYKFCHLYSVSICFLPLPHTCRMPSGITVCDAVTRMIMLRNHQYRQNESAVPWKAVEWRPSLRRKFAGPALSRYSDPRKKKV